MSKHFKDVVNELIEHLPYTILSVAIGISVLGMLTFISDLLKAEMAGPAYGLYHVFHPLHMLFSATATTAMFWRHDRKLIKAIFIGLIGAVGICGLSDIIIPYIAGYLLGVKMDLHICIIKHPMIILPFVSVGILLGLIVSRETHKSTIFSHASHILVSSMASILYLISFGLVEWMHVAGMVFIYIVLAVIIPCCTSDIVFPLLFTGESNR